MTEISHNDAGFFSLVDAVYLKYLPSQRKNPDIANTINNTSEFEYTTQLYSIFGMIMECLFNP